jgi:hypothetical protein
MVESSIEESHWINSNFLFYKFNSIFITQILYFQMYKFIYSFAIQKVGTLLIFKDPPKIS